MKIFSEDVEKRKKAIRNLGVVKMEKYYQEFVQCTHFLLL